MITIYGKPSDKCKWCAKAKILLERFGMDYDFIDVNENDDAKAYIIGMGFTTVPAIFDDGVKIGGYENLEKWIAEKWISGKISP